MGLTGKVRLQGLYRKRKLCQDHRSLSVLLRWLCPALSSTIIPVYLETRQAPGKNKA